MNSQKKMPKNPFMLPRAENSSLENLTRAISPISNSGEYWPMFKSRPTDIIKSSKVTRNLTPIESIDKNYCCDTFNNGRNSENLSFCENCKKIERELNNCKKSLNTLKERTELSERHLKQYESLLSIKDNRLKEKENMLNKQIEELEADRVRIENLKGKECDCCKNNQNDRSGFRRNIKRLSLDLTNIKITKNKSTETEEEVTGNCMLKIQEEFNLKKNQLAQLEQDLQEKIEDFKVRSKNCEEREKENSRVSAELENMKQELLKEKLKISTELENLKQGLREKESSGIPTGLENSNQEHLVKENSKVSAELVKLKQLLKDKETELLESQEKPCESCCTLKSELMSQRENFETTIAELRQAYESQSKEIEFFRSPQETLIRQTGSGIFDSSYKTPEMKFDSDDFFESQSNLSEITEGVKNHEKLPRADSFKDTVVDSEYYQTTVESKEVVSDVQEFSKGNLFSSKEATPLFIVTKLKSKLQQKAFEADQQIKLKELFYQKENQKFLDKIEQFEKFNQALMKENQEITDKSAQLVSENCSLNEKIKEKDEEIRNLNNNIASLNRKNQESVENYQRLEDLNEKLKARILIYKNKRVSQEAPIYSEELSTLINSLEEKMLDLESKETELINFKKQLVIEHENIVNNAECLKILFQDFSVEKLEFSTEKEHFNLEKSSIIEIEKKQHERMELLNMREAELFKLREELTEQGKALSTQYYRQPTRAIKRMNTQLGVFKNSSNSFE